MPVFVVANHGQISLELGLKVTSENSNFEMKKLK